MVEHVAQPNILCERQMQIFDGPFSHLVYLLDHKRYVKLQFNSQFQPEQQLFLELAEFLGRGRGLNKLENNHPG